LSERAENVSSGLEAAWPAWCCSYCAAPLEPRPHGVFCPAEGRFFAAIGGIHRMLAEDRRRERQAAVEMDQQWRRTLGLRAVPGLPDLPAADPRAVFWRQRAAVCRDALAIGSRALGRGSWDVLEIGAGCAWVSLQLVARGHRVMATDMNLDDETGLAAAETVSPLARRLVRAEAEPDALPVAPGTFDVALAAGALHRAPDVGRVLIELRRVVRRGGVLLVWDTPVVRERADGEALVTEERDRRTERCGLVPSREDEAGYLLRGELAGLFAGTGWTLDVYGWSGRFSELVGDMLDRFRYGRRRPRYPILLARRHA
jgi:SAM-dependent methyltransferase